MNLKTLKKAEILWMDEHYCKHGHTFLEHRACYDKMHKPKIAFMDIESGGSLTADFGYMLSYAIKELDGKVIVNGITQEEVRNDKKRDKRLIQQFCKDIIKYDKIVVYFGKDGKYRHDFPFLRTRAVYWGVTDFPVWKRLKVQDVYDIIKLKFKLARSSQFNACRLFGCKPGNNPVNPKIWQSALSGDKKALKYVTTHNADDVKDLEKLWKKVVQYKETTTTT